MILADYLQLILHDALLLLAVINPIGNIPVFTDMTSELNKDERNKVMNLAVLTSFSMVIAFSLIGNWVLKNLFSVTLMEFRIAGGILLFIVALRGVVAREKTYSSSSHDRRMIAVFPLAFPIIVGPGTLTVTMIMAQGGQSLRMILMALFTFVIVFLIMRYSHALMKLFGPYAGTVISRLLYIFLAAKAVSMVLKGLEEFLKHILQTPPQG